MKTIRSLLVCLVLLLLATSAMALVPRSVFVELGTATW